MASRPKRCWSRSCLRGSSNKAKTERSLTVKPGNHNRSGGDVASVELRGLTKRYGAAGGRRRRVAAHRAWAAGLPARAVRLRQDHDLAADRGLRRADGGRDRGRRPRGVVDGAHAAARAAQHVDDLPELRAVAAHDGDRERRLRAHAAQARQGADRPEGRRRSSPSPSSKRSPSAIRASSPAGSSSASRSRAR